MIDWKRYEPSSTPEKCSEEEAGLYSEQQEQRIIGESLKQARREIRQGADRTLAMEKHERRAGKIALFFFQKRTGMPF
jgi:hypothetical protein